MSIGIDRIDKIDRHRYRTIDAYRPYRRL